MSFNSESKLQFVLPYDLRDWLRTLRYKKIHTKTLSSLSIVRSSLNVLCLLHTRTRPRTCWYNLPLWHAFKGDNWRVSGRLDWQKLNVCFFLDTSSVIIYISLSVGRLPPIELFSLTVIPLSQSQSVTLITNKQNVKMTAVLQSEVTRETEGCIFSVRLYSLQVEFELCVCCVIQIQIQIQRLYCP